MANRSMKNVLKLIERANTEVPVERQFLEDLKRSIELEDKKNARKPSQSYKPSSMNCIRNMYYQVMGVDVEPDSNYTLIGICESGTDRHERIQNAIAKMKDNGFDCEYIDVEEFVRIRELPLEVVEKCGNETKLYDPKRNISFLCDGIIRYKGYYYITEFKTESAYKWQSRSGVDPKHYNQARTYSLEFNIDKVLFIYINRDICDYKAYLYTVSKAEKLSIERTIKTCDEYVKRKELPPIPEDDDSKKCYYCTYKDMCKGDVNVE